MISSWACVIMFTPARDFLLETPWRIIIPNPNQLFAWIKMLLSLNKQMRQVIDFVGAPHK
jgi:hypothetical protein